MERPMERPSFLLTTSVILPLVSVFVPCFSPASINRVPLKDTPLQSPYHSLSIHTTLVSTGWLPPPSLLPFRLEMRGRMSILIDPQRPEPKPHLPVRSPPPTTPPLSLRSRRSHSRPWYPKAADQQRQYLPISAMRRNDVFAWSKMPRTQCGSPSSRTNIASFCPSATD